MELIKQNSQTRIIKSLLIIFFGSLALALSAKIKIPFYPVPMTMQTFVVLLLGISFGYKIGLATVGLYLIEGIAGLPVFSNSPERGIGLVYFTGPTMGYLIGFLSACFFASFIKLSDNYFVIFLKLILSVSTILGFISLSSDSFFNNSSKYSFLEKCLLIFSFHLSGNESLSTRI